MPRELSFEESFKKSFQGYFARRGYKTPISIPNLIWRWFFVSLTQRPFGGFWRVWNPFLGFFLLKLYRKLGGDKNRFVACLLTFAICGFGHDLLRVIMNSTHGLQLRRMMEFLMFGLFVALTSSLRVQRRMRKLPPAANIVVNLVFIALSFMIGNFLWGVLESSI